MDERRVTPQRICERLAQLDWEGIEPPNLPKGFKAALSELIEENGGKGFELPPFTLSRKLAENG